MNLRDLGYYLSNPPSRCPGKFHYTRYGSTNEECTGHLLLRCRRVDGEIFWGCSTFPNCTFSEPFIPSLDIFRRPEARSTGHKTRPRRGAK